MKGLANYVCKRRLSEVLASSGAGADRVDPALVAGPRVGREEYGGG